MIDILDDLTKQLSIIDELNNYYIEFGILTEDEFKMVEVNVLNTDDTITKIPMSIHDVMYLTEYGTLTIPARPVLQSALVWVNSELDSLIDKICDNVFNYNWTIYDIDSEMEKFAIKVKFHIQYEMESMIRSAANLASLINQKDENKYLFDLNKLKNYIKCRIFRKK